jgi:hypothetical protein
MLGIPRRKHPEMKSLVEILPEAKKEKCDFPPPSTL